MAELKADILVLGAGMVGVGAALHLQRRGRDVILVDRHSLAGEETSFGNGGLIECASVFPYMFPRDFGQVLQYALNRSSQVRYQIADLPTFLPWLVRYFLAGAGCRSRSGWIGQSLCGALPAQGGTLFCGRCQEARTRRRRMACRRIRWRGGRARSRGGVGPLVRPGVSSAWIFHPARS